MFEHLEEFKEWYNEEVYTQFENDYFDSYRVAWELYSAKEAEIKGKEKLSQKQISDKANELCRAAIEKSLDLLKVWDWDYDDYVKDMEAEGEEPSEDDYSQLLQIYTDDFLEEEFDEDLKNAMQNARDYEWRDEYEFKRKLRSYLEDLEKLDAGFDDTVYNIRHLALKEVFEEE
jgi:hypothetical protein